MSSLRLIRGRIKSVGNTKKITHAMELVSAAKVRKSVNQVLQSRPYSAVIWDLAVNLADKVQKELHPLLQERPFKRGVVLVISSNRGLCGGFNSQLVQKILKTFSKELSIPHQSVLWDFITFGKRGRDTLRRSGVNIIADFPKSDLTYSVADLEPITKMAIDEYISGKYDRFYVAYTDFISSLRQEPKVKQVLPFIPAPDESLGQIEKSLRQSASSLRQSAQGEYLIEPSPAELLNYLLPQIVRLQVYQAVLESEASEHSARMMAMKNATSAAQDMILDLTMAFNQARQASITQELSEISATRSALGV